MPDYYKTAREVFRDLQKEADKYNTLIKNLKEDNKRDTEKVRYYEKAYKDSTSEHDKKRYKRTIDMLNAKRELRKEILKYDKDN